MDMDIKSERVRKALELSNTKFKRFSGVKKQTFGRMLEILHNAFAELHKQGGKPFTKLQVEDKLLLTSQYWWEYRTMEHLAYEYRVVKSAVYSAWFGWKIPWFAMARSDCQAKNA